MDNLPASKSDWFDQEVDIDAFRDKRLGERLRTFLMQLAGAVGNRVCIVCVCSCLISFKLRPENTNL